MTLRRQALWILVLAVIGVDLWWSGTSSNFAVWWVPVIVLNVVCLVMILYPIVRGSD